MKQFCSILIFGCILFWSCRPSNYFLVNSDMMAEYNRTTGDWRVIWTSSMKKVVNAADSVFTRFDTDSIRRDSVRAID